MEKLDDHVYASDISDFENHFGDLGSRTILAARGWCDYEESHQEYFILNENGTYSIFTVGYSVYIGEYSHEDTHKDLDSAILVWE